MPAGHIQEDGVTLTPEQEAAKAAEEKAAADKAAEDQAATEKKAADEKAAAEKAGEGLTPADRAALQAVVDKERAATKAAEKTAREAQKKLDDIEAASLSETEKLKKEAEDGKALAATATAKLRKANLISEFSKADHGIADARAATALALNDSLVEFDDGDEPKDPADVVKKLIEAYPVLKGDGKKDAPNINGGGGGGEQKTPALNADELAMAKKFGMTPEEYQKYKDPQPAAAAA